MKIYMDTHPNLKSELPILYDKKLQKINRKKYKPDPLGNIARFKLWQVILIIVIIIIIILVCLFISKKFI